MDSDTDSEEELPPGWKIVFDRNRKFYYNNILQEQQDEHPLKTMRKFYKNSTSSNYKASKSCLYKNVKKHTQFVQIYDSFTSSEQVLGNKDLSTKIAVVTGGCSGIGLELVYQLASANCRVIVGCPDKVKCSEKIKTRVGNLLFNEFIDVLELNFLAFNNVLSFVKTLREIYDEVHIIVLCAAVMAPSFSLTSDGFEQGFQINVLSQAYLVKLILDMYSDSPNIMRFVFCVCEAHRAVQKFEISDLNPTSDKYDGLYAYCLHNVCKLILVSLFVKKYFNINTSNTETVTGKRYFFACHPGNLVSGTKINRYSFLAKILFYIGKPFTKTLSQASGVVLYTALNSVLINFPGAYINNYCICEPSTEVRNEKNQSALWKYLMDSINELKC